MGLFSDLIGGAINSAINYNDKDHFFKILCLVIYADSGNVSESDVEVATDLYNTIFNEDMIAVQIYKKLKSTYQDMYNSDKSPEEIIEDIESGRIDRNKLKMFFICACYMSFANADNIEKISKKKLYMVYLIKDGFYLDDDEVNDAYIFAKNNFGINGMGYQNMVTLFEAAFEYFENNGFEEDDDNAYLSCVDKNISISTQKDEAIQDNEDMEIEENNKKVEALIDLSLSYMNNFNYKASIEVLLKAIKIKPNDCTIWYDLATSYKFDKQYDKAIDSYLKASELNSDDFEIAEILFDLGNTYIEIKRYQEAINTLLKSIELNPNNESTWSILGHAYNDSGQYKKAIDSFLKSIEIDPNDYITWLMLGTSYYNDGQYSEAINSLLKSIELNPNNETTWSRLGHAYNDSEQYKKAIDSFLKAIEINPENSDTWKMLGVSYYNDGQYNEAINALLKSLKLNSDNWATLSVLGNSYYKNGQYEEAIDSSLKSIELVPNVDAWITLCKIYRKNGNTKELENAVAKVKELNPNLDYDKLIMEELVLKFKY
ncbi:tetratricopeptide repeat protein [Brachyspira catarrhinii]|uniref:Tetratricopeptide repeat protein n=1 Tax=Brachyspira catarrhinii TaxID=2528966 RepID=A0ABY2TTB5_9SPIR|nr:tetratricopeptide repeat protein [Brachyspira catarrhinii]TKZ36112.1 tetratricopeptide repeat protein [Brachyspira catarrhinii]